MKNIFVITSILFFASGSLTAQNTWTQKNSFSGVARMAPVAFSIGAKGYIGTGGDFGSITHDDFWEYEPSTDSWTQKATLPGGARYRAVGFSSGVKGYIGTGLNAGTYYNDFWEYDQALNTWTQKASMGLGRMGCAGFVIGTKIYVGTGYTSTFVNDFWEFNTLTNAWTQKANFAGAAKIYAVGFCIGAKGYLGTGVNLNGGGMGTQDFWQYDTTFNSWTAKASLPGIGRSEAIGFAIGNTGYIGTGTSSFGNGSVDDFWKYNAVTDTWTAIANYGGGVCEHAAGFVIDCKAYVGTGIIDDNNSTLKNDLWELASCTVGLEELSSFSFSVFPNPAKENVTVTIHAAQKDVRVEILNVEGKKIFENTLHNRANKIPLTNLAAATYFVKVFDGENVYVQKLVVR